VPQTVLEIKWLFVCHHSGGDSMDWIAVLDNRRHTSIWMEYWTVSCRKKGSAI